MSKITDEIKAEIRIATRYEPRNIADYHIAKAQVLALLAIAEEMHESNILEKSKWDCLWVNNVY